MGKLNHNRPIASGDMLGAENQRFYQGGYKFPPIAPGCMLDLGCEFSKEALELRKTLSRAEIRKIRMDRQRAEQANEIAQKKQQELKDARDEFLADVFEKPEQ